jgi:hypothetical protein
MTTTTKTTSQLQRDWHERFQVARADNARKQEVAR